MGMRKGIFALVFCLVATAARAQSDVSVEIDLQQQMAYLIRGRHVVLSSPISSGRAGHLTGTGSFKVIEKERNHYSSIYGKIVDAAGNTVVADADVDMKVPRGCKFVPAPMPWFMRFHGADGMHAGYLPGYPASHGCVRMPDEYAMAFYRAVDVGTPVHVFGRTPLQREYYRYGPQPAQPHYQQRYQPRYYPWAQPQRREPVYDPRFSPPPPPQPDWW